jgi:hypothetical protein
MIFVVFFFWSLALPTVLTHLGIMQTASLLMGLAGGVVVYGTILVHAKSLSGCNDDHLT